MYSSFTSFYEKFQLKNQLIQNFRDCFRKHGFCEVSVPTFEKLISSTEQRFEKNTGTLFKFIDQDGDVSVLQSDVTSSIASMVVKELENLPKPLKLSYASNVFRMVDQKPVEKTQVGVEIFEEESLEADFELLLLALKSLKESGETYKLAISHSKFYKGFINAYGYSQEESKKLGTFLNAKNKQGLLDYIQSKDCCKEEIEFFSSILSLCGTPSAVLERAKKLIYSEEMELALKELEELFASLSPSSLLSNIDLDLALIPELDYYSGLIMKGFVLSSPSPILIGGRYDSLTELFGKKIPACGFAIDIDALSSSRINPIPKQSLDVTILSKETSLRESYYFAETLRKAGLSVLIEKYVCATEQIQSKSLSKTKFLLLPTEKEKCYQVIDMKKNAPFILKEEQVLNFISNSNMDSYFGH